jgi:ribosome-binding protein aMBF1 (putative translation factor)
MRVSKTIVAAPRCESRTRGGASVQWASSVRTYCKAAQESDMTKLKDVRFESREKGFSADLSESSDVEHALAEAIAKARGSAGLTQEEVAQRMQTTQSNIARLETGRTIPSTRTLIKFAAAIGARLSITFERTGP